VPPGRLAADFTIANDDSVDERFEVTAYSWSQKGGVDERRPDVGDVLIFPRLLTLAPGERTRIRVGVLETNPSVESDYRIAVEQLFDPLRGRPGIHFLLAYDIPLFIEPARALDDARVVRIVAAGRDLRVTIRNDGNVHAGARSIRVEWHGVSSVRGGPFYVLPHDTMAFSLPLPPCGSGIVTIAPDRDARIAPMNAPLSIPCAPAHAGLAAPLRVVASVRVNRVPYGDAVIVRAEHDIYVRARDVSGVPFPHDPVRTAIDGETYLSLASSGIEYAYDASQLALDLDYRVATAQRLSLPVPAPALYANGSSGTLAYAGTLARGGRLVLSTLATFATASGQVHLGFAKLGASVYRTDLDAVLFEGDQSGAMLLGDQTLAAGGALPALPLFGVGTTRGTSIRTAGERAPFERISGTLVNPTTISIDVGGEAPIEIGAEPGRFVIDGVPSAARVSAVDDVTNLPLQIDVRRSLGENLIAPGWRELDAAAGIPRICLYACATYRGFVAGGSLLVGDSLFLASGPHAEYLDGRAGIGYDFVDADPDRALQLSAGLGPLDGVLASYQQRAGRFFFGFGYAATGAPAYNAGGDLIAQRRSLAEFLNATYRRIRLQYELRTYQSLATAATFDLIDDIPLFRSTLRLDLRDRCVRGRNGKISLSVLLPVTTNRWRDLTLLGFTLGAHQRPAATLSSQIDTPSGFDISGGANGTMQASYASDAIALSASNDGLLTFSGALAFLHGVHPVRDPDAGYVVAAGAPGDLIADTDGRIHAIGAGSSTAFPLPSSDRPTGIAYVQRNVTIDSDASLSAARVYPAPGAGALVVVTHTRLFAVIGTIADPKWRYGSITLASGVTSPVGADGLFYFEGLAAGKYRAQITGAAGTCSTTIAVPASNERQIDIGAIVCGASVRGS
jgi:P pilus assembly chaperone PapD